MSIAAVAALGAYHGLNPAMGWLFAVAIGFQHRRAAAVLYALPAIALGHALSVAVALGLISLAAIVIPLRVLQFAGAAVLLGFAAYLYFRRGHAGRGGMRMGFSGLVLWSFLMTTAHGAGLMLFPLAVQSQNGPSHLHEHAAHMVYTNSVNLLAVHSLAMFAAMTGAALLTFHLSGVSFLRRAWINLDAVWIGALLLAGILTLAA
jgi:hypothetical protein